MHVYLAHGGPDNLRSCTLSQRHRAAHRCRLRGAGRAAGLGSCRADPVGASRPRIGILFYRAQYAAGNTAYVEALADAVDAAGGIGVPIFATLARCLLDLLEYLGSCDALITTVLAAGGTKPATASAGGDDEAWDVRALAALDIPILQGLCLTWDRASWAASDEGMTPLDVATQVAVPEFDGRSSRCRSPSRRPMPMACRPTSLIMNGVAGSPRSRSTTRACGTSRPSSGASRSCRPTRRSIRIGNAVGLDTPYR